MDEPHNKLVNPFKLIFYLKHKLYYGLTCLFSCTLAAVLSSINWSSKITSTPPDKRGLR